MEKGSGSSSDSVRVGAIGVFCTCESDKISNPEVIGLLAVFETIIGIRLDTILSLYFLFVLE